MTTLKAEKRNMDVKAKKLRREGFVTGNVFGREIYRSIPIKMKEKEAEHVLKTNHKGSQIFLDIDGKKYHVLIKDIAYNFMKHGIEEIDFQALVKGQKVHSVAEIVLENREKVREGVLGDVLAEIPYSALPEHLVEQVYVDVGDLRTGDVIRVSDLAITKNEHLELQIDLDEVVVSVTAVNNHGVEETEEEETEI